MKINEPYTPAFDTNATWCDHLPRYIQSIVEVELKGEPETVIREILFSPNFQGRKLRFGEWPCRHCGGCGSIVRINIDSSTSAVGAMKTKYRVAECGNCQSLGFRGSIADRTDDQLNFQEWIKSETVKENLRKQEWESKRIRIKNLLANINKEDLELLREIFSGSSL